MTANETITINTNYGEKSVISSVYGNILNLLDAESTFLQLSRGINTIKYDAESNLNGLVVTMYYYEKFLGV